MTEYMVHLYYHQPIEVPTLTQTAALNKAYENADALIEAIEEAEIMESSYVKETIFPSRYIVNIHYYITRKIEADNENEALEKAGHEVGQEIKHIPDIRELDSSHAVDMEEYN